MKKFSASFAFLLFMLTGCVSTTPVESSNFVHAETYHAISSGGVLKPKADAISGVIRENYKAVFVAKTNRVPLTKNHGLAVVFFLEGPYADLKSVKLRVSYPKMQSPKGLLSGYLERDQDAYDAKGKRVVDFSYFFNEDWELVPGTWTVEIWNGTKMLGHAEVTTYVPPKAYVSGDPFPDMTGRNPDLIPELLPARVRYEFADNDTVNRLADQLKAGLTSGDAGLFGDAILLYPGAWRVFKPRGVVGQKDAKDIRLLDPAKVSKIDPAQGLNGLLNNNPTGRFLRSKEESALLAREMSAVLSEDGGFVVRSLSTLEMAKWWIYIGFNIEEPVYVVASKGGRYKFVVGFAKDEVIVVDELNSLPDHL